MGLSRADSMVGVLVDACGWVSLVDAGLNLDISLNNAIGEAELKLTDSVGGSWIHSQAAEGGCFWISFTPGQSS